MLEHLSQCLSEQFQIVFIEAGLVCEMDGDEIVGDVEAIEDGEYRASIPRWVEVLIAAKLRGARRWSDAPCGHLTPASCSGQSTNPNLLNSQHNNRLIRQAVVMFLASENHGFHQKRLN